jgi:hypothetical protein
LILTLVSTLKTSLERTVVKRTSRRLVLIPNEIQSHCLRSKQSGEVSTRISLYFQAKNLSDDSVKLSEIRLARPVVRKRRIRQTTLSVQSPASAAFGSEVPISPHSPTQGSASIVIDCPIGDVGKAMRVVVFVQDNLGQWYKLVFSHIKMIGTR